MKTRASAIQRLWRLRRGLQTQLESASPERKASLQALLHGCDLFLPGIVVGLWYLALLVMILKRSGGQHGAMSALPGIVVGTIGLLTMGGCISRLRKRVSQRP